MDRRLRERKENDGSRSGPTKDLPPESHLENVIRLIQERKDDSSRSGPTKDLPREFHRGIDGQFDAVIRGLGLSGLEDFAIPVAAWEARKIRSLFDLPRSQLQHLDSPNRASGVQCEFIKPHNVVRVCSDTVESVGCPTTAYSSHSGVNDVAGEQCESIKLNGCNDGSDGGGGGGDICKVADRLIDTVRVSNVSQSQDDAIEYIGCSITAETSRSGGGGIKGVRPPFVAPPPSIWRPVIDETCSTWDILKSLAPMGDRVLTGFRSFDDEEEEDVFVKKEELNGTRLREAALLYDSCSFTSNDDDFSTTATMAMSDISPNGRDRRTITCWQKGVLLASESFVSVYEGMTDAHTAT